MRFKNILLVIGMAMLLFSANAQRLDSLETLLKGAEGKERINLLLELAREWVVTDTAMGLRLAAKGYAEAIAIPILLMGLFILR